MSLKFTPTGFALWVLSIIQDPDGTTDQGVTAKRRAIGLMAAAGLTTAEANALLQEWLDSPPPANGRLADEDSTLVKAMAVGARKLLASR